MKLRMKEKNYLFVDCLNRYSGSHDARKFYYEVAKHTIKYLKNFFDDVSGFYKEHGFHHREQHVKSYLTAAINSVTNSSFMQEASIGRKHPKQEKSLNGRVDYWANFGNCSFLMEIKHDWIRYFPNESKITVYKSVKDKLDAASKQIETIKDRPDFNYRGNLYGLGLVVTPIFIKSEKIVCINSDWDLKNHLINNLKKIGVNIILIWFIEKKYLFINEFEDENENTIKESYPALCFVGKYAKLSKTR